MNETMWQRLDRYARSLVPFAMTVMLVLITMVPVPIPSYALIVPMLSLISVYYWVIHRPGLLPPAAVFVIGLIQDLLSGSPLGVYPVVLLLVYGVAYSQRRFFFAKSFLIVWWGFLLISFVAVLVNWALHSLLLGTLISSPAAVFQFLVTVALYPPLSWVLRRLQLIVPRPAEIFVADVPGP